MIEEMTRYEALLRCRDMAGSDSQMARDMGVTQPRVWRWVNQSKQLPAEYVLHAERLYGVSRHALRPDIYPAVGHGSHPRWYGVDLAAGPDVSTISCQSRSVSFDRRAQLKRGAA